MGGINDENYVSYDLCILQYDTKKAQLLKEENKVRKKQQQKLEMMKFKLDQMKTQMSRAKQQALLDNLNSEIDNQHQDESDDSKSKDFDLDDIQKAKLTSEVPEEGFKPSKIKSERNFVSFQPLPDPFYDVVNSSRMYKM